MTADDGQVLARQAEHLAWFVRLSLDLPEQMRRMQQMAAGLHEATRPDALLATVLDGAMSLTRGDFGNVQLLDPASGGLKIVSQSGFDSEFTEYFSLVDDDHSSCGRAARQFAQTAVADVMTERSFAPHRQIAASAGFRAVQSTPLADSSGRLIGMVSTHFRRPALPAPEDLRVMQLYADVAGEAVGRQAGPAHGDQATRQAGYENGQVDTGPTDRMAATERALAEFGGEIVQRLSAAGLSLASAQAMVGQGAAGDRVAAAADELDRAIAGVRATLFGMRASRPRE